MNSTGFKRLDFEFDNTFAGLYISFDKNKKFGILFEKIRYPRDDYRRNLETVYLCLHIYQ